ncbi:MAG: nickel pincer cofactor biosynthesis protein LarC [Actinobacteria bacterium]|nr:MAG: nickel pincer cofactor biosynthesis protein LarC [Actinomycetota bacterium]
MRVAYFDCFSGVSGDKTLGAMIDLGVPLDLLEQELRKVALGSYELESTSVLKNEIAATRIKVHVFEHRIVRTWSSVRATIENSDLSDSIKEKTLAIFGDIAEIESQLHHKPIGQVHFHEVGAVDSIVDIVGTVVGIEHLGFEEIISSPIPTGTGMVRTEHGALPVPAPATIALLEGVPSYSTAIPAELTTPTGAAIIKRISSRFGEMPLIVPEAVGYGAAKRDLEIPNVLRVVVGELVEEQAEQGGVVILETNVDNTSPEVLGSVVERALEMGAIDVWQTPILMKKNRSATLLSLMCEEADEARFVGLLMSETNTLGVRKHHVSRTVASREIMKLKSSMGTARVKIGRYQGRVTSITPEHDDCVRLAKKTGLPIKEVHDRLKAEASEKVE